MEAVVPIIGTGSPTSLVPKAKKHYYTSSGWDYTRQRVVAMEVRPCENRRRPVSSSHLDVSNARRSC